VIESVSPGHGAIHIAANDTWSVECSLGFTCLTMTIASTNGIQGLAFNFIISITINTNSIKREDLHSVVVVVSHRQVMGEGLKTQACWCTELVKLFALTSKGLEVFQAMDSIISINFGIIHTTKPREELQAIVCNNRRQSLVGAGDQRWNPKFPNP
jgi:hypothetical protein